MTYTIRASSAELLDANSMWSKFLLSLDKTNIGHYSSNRAFISAALEPYGARLLGSFYSQRLVFTDLDKFIEFKLKWG